MKVTTKAGCIIGMTAYLADVNVTAKKGCGTRIMTGVTLREATEINATVNAALLHLGYSTAGWDLNIDIQNTPCKRPQPSYGLAVALGILAATGQTTANVHEVVCCAELSLNGKLCAVRGVFPITRFVRTIGPLIVATGYHNAEEASIISEVKVAASGNVTDLIRDLEVGLLYVPGPDTPNSQSPLDLQDIRGCPAEKRGLEIAAAGGHNLLMFGYPGSGKTMLARRMTTILPEMCHNEKMEVTSAFSGVGMLRGGLMQERPFRAPHHTVSETALVGSRVTHHLGEVGLANLGVLFLDEVPEFKRAALETLLQVVEDGFVPSHQSPTATIPHLVASMLPCACGRPGDRCTCSTENSLRYLNRLTDHFITTFDMQLAVSGSSVDERRSGKRGDPSEVIRKRVEAAREIQMNRYTNERFDCNAELPGTHIGKYCPLTEGAKRFLKSDTQRPATDLVQYNAIMRLARTIADLHGAAVIGKTHVGEALAYRALDTRKSTLARRVRRGDQ